MELVDILSLKSRDELIDKIGLNKDTELYAFFASPASHSLSPQMYNAAFKAQGLNKYYFASDIPEGSLGDAIDRVRLFDIKGFNVSMPHKENVIDYLDDVDDSAKYCMAVNTVVNSDGFLKGYNTDSIGAIKALNNVGCQITGEACVLFGLGGAGKAILAGLIREKAERVNVFVREPNRKDFTDFLNKLSEMGHDVKIEILDLNDNVLLYQRIHESTILINSTSVGMGDTIGQSFIYDETFLHNRLTVMDIIYEPRETRLLELAGEARCRKVINGLSMLYQQGKACYKLYTGGEMPIMEEFI